MGYRDPFASAPIDDDVDGSDKVLSSAETTKRINDAVAGVEGGLPLDVLAKDPEAMMSADIVRDDDGAVLSATLSWPDGTPGTYLALVVSVNFPGAVDSFAVTYGEPVQHTYTQPAVTRDPGTGDVTEIPAIVES